MIKKISSKTVYKNRWMEVQEDQVEFANGSQGIYGVVRKPDFALIIPFQNGEFTLVRQFRYPVGESFWEFPQGSWESDPSKDPKELAKSELREETGLLSENLQEIGYLYEAYGYCDQGFHIFLASNFQKGEQELEAAEAGMEVKTVSIAEFENMISKGEIKDAPTIAAYGVFKIKTAV